MRDALQTLLEEQDAYDVRRMVCEVLEEASNAGVEAASLAFLQLKELHGKEARPAGWPPPLNCRVVFECVIAQGRIHVHACIAAGSEFRHEKHHLFIFQDSGD